MVVEKPISTSLRFSNGKADRKCHNTPKGIGIDAPAANCCCFLGDNYQCGFCDGGAKSYHKSKIIIHVVEPLWANLLAKPIEVLNQFAGTLWMIAS